MASAVVEPVTFQKKKEYEDKMASAFEDEMRMHEVRVVENEEYARRTTLKLLEEYKQHKVEEERKAADPSQFYLPAEPNFLVVVMIRSKVNIAPKPKKILELFRLKSINNAVIIKNNKCTRNMLKLVKDHVAYGYLSYELLRRMIYLRGHGKIGSSKVRLSNENIEKAFDGKFRCIEELVNVIYFGKEGMKEVCNFLYSIALSCPVGGFKGKKNKDYLQGGSTNNHHELLGEMISKML